MNLASLLRSCVQRYGSALALRDLEHGVSLTFHEMGTGLSRVAASLDKLQVPKGSRIALLGGADSTYLLCDYGVMVSGRIRVPLDPGLGVGEQEAQLLDADVGLLIYADKHVARAEELAQRIKSLSIKRQSEMVCHSAGDGVLAPDVMGADDLASLSYTGGTTGRPKAVMINHRGLCATVQNIQAARRIRPGDMMLNVRPTWPIAAVVLLAHLAAGGTLLLGGRYEPHAFMELLQKYRVRNTSLVPTHLARLMDAVDPSHYDLDSLQAIDVGAAAIPPELFTRLVGAFGTRIGVIYGLTEASWSCYLPPCSLETKLEGHQKRMRSVGKPLEGVEICAFSADGMRLPADEQGELCIRGAHIMVGYWKQQDATDAVLRDGWFRSGDLGHIGQDGYVYITGRIKDVIRTGGKSVVPAEVESVLLCHPAVAEAVVVGLPDHEWGEIIAAAVVLRLGVPTPSEPELIEWCREKLSAFKKPRRVLFVDEIAKSHYGKALKGRIRDQLLLIA